LLALAYLRSLIGEGNYIQEPVVCVSESRLYLTSAYLDKPLCDAFFLSSKQYTATIVRSKQC
jgi:hypothetical protein